MAYKIGAATVVAGVLIWQSSGLLGGTVFTSLTRLLSLLGAPEDRWLLPPGEPQAGSEIIDILGWWVIGCGVWVFGFRMLIDLLGLTAKPMLVGNLGTAGKFCLGLIVVGLLVQVSVEMPGVLLEWLRFVEFRPFETISTVGSLIVLCGLVGGVVAAINRFAKSSP